MEWGSIIGSIIVALMAAIGLLLALRKRKKSGPKSLEELFNHLRGMGIRASLAEKGVEEEKVGVTRGMSQRSEGVIRVEGRHVDFINVVSTASQYGVYIYIEFLVRTPGMVGRQQRRKTRLVKKKGMGAGVRVADVGWRGDDYLSRELEFDYSLSDKLLQAEYDKLKNGILIIPEPKYEYARIRITYLLLSHELFEAIDIIARHIKSGW